MHRTWDLSAANPASARSRRPGAGFEFGTTSPDPLHRSRRPPLVPPFCPPGRTTPAACHSFTQASATNGVCDGPLRRNRRLGERLLRRPTVPQILPGRPRVYDQTGPAGTQYQALRALRQLVDPHGCLRTHTRYDEHRAWHTQRDTNRSPPDLNLTPAVDFLLNSHPPERRRGQPRPETRHCKQEMTAASPATQQPRGIAWNIQSC